MRGGTWCLRAVPPLQHLPSAPRYPGWSDRHLHLHGLLLLSQAGPLHSKGASFQGHGERVPQGHLGHQLAVLLGLSQDLGGGKGQRSGATLREGAQRPSTAGKIPAGPSLYLLQFGPTFAEPSDAHSVALTPRLCALIFSSGKHG